MFACRSDELVRTKPAFWIAALTFGLLIAALLLPISHASGAVAKKSSTTASADSAARAESDDDGISVRVVEDGKQAAVRRVKSVRIGAGGLKIETTGKGKGAEPAAEAEPPAPPEAPEPPDLPDSPSNDLVRFGQDIEIPAGKVIDGDVVAIGGSVTVYGRVKGSCTAVGGSVSVRGNGVVEGDAVSVGGVTTTSDSASVGGSNVSVGAWPFKGHPGAGMLPLLGIMGLGAIAGVATTIVKFLLTIFFAWLCLVLVRERMVHATERMGRDFGKSFLWGLLGWGAMIVAIPAVAIVGAIAIVILCITIIGIPVAILLAIALVFALMGTVLAIVAGAFLGYLNGAMYIGQRLFSGGVPGRVSPIRAIIFGALLIMGLKILGDLLGFVGVVFLMPIGIAFGIAAAVLGIVLTTAGLGAMILTRFSRGPEAGPSMAAEGAGWYTPPPVTPPPGAPPGTQAPPANAPPQGGTSDAP